MPPAARLVDATRPRDAAPAAIVGCSDSTAIAHRREKILPHLGDPPKSLRKKKERPGGRSVGGAIAVPVLRRRVLTGVQPGLHRHAFQDRWCGVYFSYARGASLSRLGGSTTLMAATP